MLPRRDRSPSLVHRLPSGWGAGRRPEGRKCSAENISTPGDSRGLGDICSNRNARATHTRARAHSRRDGKGQKSDRAREKRKNGRAVGWAAGNSGRGRSWPCETERTRQQTRSHTRTGEHSSTPLTIFSPDRNFAACSSILRRRDKTFSFRLFSLSLSRRSVFLRSPRTGACRCRVITSFVNCIRGGMGAQEAHKKLGSNDDDNILSFSPLAVGLSGERLPNHLLKCFAVANTRTQRLLGELKTKKRRKERTRRGVNTLPWLFELR